MPPSQPRRGSPAMQASPRKHAATARAFGHEVCREKTTAVLPISSQPNPYRGASHANENRLRRRRYAMNALLLESSPLLRIALQQMLLATPGIQQVFCVELVDLLGGYATPGDEVMLVLGLARWDPRGEEMFKLICRIIGARHVLLLADLSSPGQIPAAPAAGRLSWASRSADPAVIEVAIQRCLAGAFGRGSGGTADAEREGADGGAAGNADAGSSQGAGPGAGKDQRWIIAEAHRLQLTVRQYEVLVLLSRGHPLKTISRMLNISMATVKTHARMVYRRLRARNKGEAVYAARKLGSRLLLADAAAVPGPGA